ncbi:MAG: class I SAM-dependent methyltransferase [Bryobacteraceae bacterium]|jgi:caffeoyl-CoA O-methyltransferase
MSRQYTPITPELAAYIREVSLREPAPLKKLRGATEDHPHAFWQISPEQGQLLHLLALAIGAKKALEVGVFMGYSSTWIALALPDGGKLVACERSEDNVARARGIWREAGVEKKIDLRMGPAIETLDALVAEGQAGSFDFAFIDANKDGYIDYYERALTLVRPGGLIAADNVLMHGTVSDSSNHDADTEGIRAFNRKLRDDKRVAISIATVGDGFLLACKL